MVFKCLAFDRPVQMPCKLMQTDKNDKKLEQSVSMYLHVLERPCKRQIVTDQKSRNASQLKLIKYKSM